MLDLESAPDKPLLREAAYELARRSDGHTGRPRDLTDELGQQIVSSIASGSFMTVAAARVSVSAETVYGWLRRGQGDQAAGLDTVFGRFEQAISRAQAEAEAEAVAVLQRGGDGKYKDWRAPAWWLERRHKERWSLPKEQQSQGITLQLSNEQIASLVDALRIGAATNVTPEPDDHKG
jgi:hypothetical protein